MVCELVIGEHMEMDDRESGSKTPGKWATVSTAAAHLPWRGGGSPLLFSLGRPTPLLHWRLLVLQVLQVLQRLRRLS